MALDRLQVMLAALAASDGAVHYAVQVQKLFFLIDHTIPFQLGGPHFQFIPFDYGPYDAEVYHALQHLAQQDLVTIAREPNYQVKTYRLTVQGQHRGEEVLSTLPLSIIAYLRELSTWVRSLSFAQLVSAIYRAYPDMQVHSVFREARR